MAHFEDSEQIINEKLEMQGEYFNGYVCQQLSDYFNRRRNKLPIDFIDQNFNDSVLVEILNYFDTRDDKRIE